ncbi:MAG: HEAT repeat domain-containing protein, partial [Armatimonadetes bacterium]|nr:HEAT repeat domain-containing protein [Armatimonadota bacterium]
MRPHAMMLAALAGALGAVSVAGKNPADAPGALGNLVQQLTDPKAQTTLEQDPRAVAALELVALGKPAVDPLIGALRHEQPEVRRTAAWALGEIGD